MEQTINSTAAMAAPSATFADVPALDALAQEAQDSGQYETKPGAAPAPPAPKLTAANCMTEAGMLIGMGLQLLSKKFGVTLTQDQRKDGTEKLAEVLAKYDGQLPDWIKKYQEEFMLGMWCAGVAWQCYEIAQQKKAEAMAPAADGGGNAQAG
jgi:hypothetical protein